VATGAGRVMKTLGSKSGHAAMKKKESAYRESNMRVCSLVLHKSLGRQTHNKRDSILASSVFRERAAHVQTILSFSLLH
jgi:hypothetical protein